MMASGAVKYVHIVGRGMQHKAGRQEYVGAVQDVTKQRTSEEALGTVRSELAHVARMTTLGALTASIAHEVRQPLSGIITNAGTCVGCLPSIFRISKGLRKPPVESCATAIVRLR